MARAGGGRSSGRGEKAGKRFFTIQEAAEHLKCSASKVRTAVAEGRLKPLPRAQGPRSFALIARAALEAFARLPPLKRGRPFARTKEAALAAS